MNKIILFAFGLSTLASLSSYSMEAPRPNLKRSQPDRNTIPMEAPRPNLKRSHPDRNTIPMEASRPNLKRSHPDRNTITMEAPRPNSKRSHPDRNTIPNVFTLLQQRNTGRLNSLDKKALEAYGYNRAYNRVMTQSMKKRTDAKRRKLNSLPDIPDFSLDD